ncbi:co-chaperone GroES [bacterium]|jgi:chaperonin GroES|nr:co-chaperone GroES [Gemmatimonadota bacterium]MCH2664730.1 co-chaperone GroES [bacterium]HCK08752.1 co-chaperone GroES [Candidatus Latescibacterota bacterium]|tara:strand:- start:41 stop:334 length:294 start_codon:yes stop_codon:yes gene_type:complete
MAVKVKPLGDRVLVQPESEEEQVKGGIIIPDTAKEKPQRGKVVAIGTGKTDDSGKKIALNVKKGDNVLYGKYSGTEVRLDDEDYLIMPEGDILAIIE